MRWLLVALGACGNGDPKGDGSEPSDTATTPSTDSGTPVACGEPSLAVGTGDFSYAPFAATDPRAEVIYGGQGGWHIWVAGDLVGLGPRIVQVPTLTLVDTGTIIAGDPAVPESADLSVPAFTTGVVGPMHGVATDCGYQFAGGHAFILDNIFGGGNTNWDAIQGLDGLAARLDVTVTDLDTYEMASGSAEFSIAITQESAPQ